MSVDKVLTSNEAIISNKGTITEVRVTRPNEDGSFDTSQCMEPILVELFDKLFK